MTRRFVIWLLLTLISGAVGVAYADFVTGRIHVGGTVGLAIGGLLVALELFYVQTSSGAWLRRLPLPAFIGLLTLTWSTVIGACLHYIPLSMLGENLVATYDKTTFGQDFFFAFLVSLLFNLSLRIRSLVGPRVLRNFVIGRYHRPLREERIFMFLDLVGSTRLSEELGDIRVQTLIGRFFFDIAEPIARHGGETHRYIGDEVVVTWPLEAAGNAACLDCILDIYRRVDERASSYQSEFGVTPKFRIGLHGGSVVASEIGDEKREIVYFGDTVNTAARLGSACKTLGHEILASTELLERMTLPKGLHRSDLGAIELAGKREPLQVSTLTSNR